MLPLYLFSRFSGVCRAFVISTMQGIPCDLVTGEERKYADPDEVPSGHVACTVEMTSVTQPCKYSPLIYVLSIDSCIHSSIHLFILTLEIMDVFVSKMGKLNQWPTHSITLKLFENFPFSFV